jgi:glucokinase
MIEKNNAPVLAVDIGGTKILTALFSTDGSMLAKGVTPTLAQEGADAVIARLGSAIDNLMGENRIKPSQLGAISIACAGGIDSGRGVVVTASPNLPGWADVPLGDIIRGRFKVETCVVNDASAAALGEYRFGAGRGVKNLVLFTMGTGIGGGIIADSKLYLGAVGGAAELGHMTIDASGPKCGCGNTGCLEMLASGKAIARDAVKHINQGEKSSLIDMVEGKLENINAEIIGRAARNGDRLARDVIARAAYYLGIGMVNVVNIFNPEMIVIGGGMAEMGDMLIEPGRRMVAERAFSISSRSVRIVTAQLGNEAGVHGAAALALDMRRQE